MKNTLILVTVILLVGCATAFQPKIGMSLDEWQDQCMTHNWSRGNLVAAEDDVEVYTCHPPNVLHAFQDGKLVKVMHTEAQPNPNSAALMGLGLGLINSAQPRTHGATCTQMGNFTNCY